MYLLHGADDNVIPAIESALLARTLRERGVTVTFLATPLVTHAEVDHRAAVSSAWALVRFWSAVLGQKGDSCWLSAVSAWLGTTPRARRRRADSVLLQCRDLLGGELPANPRARSRASVSGPIATRRSRTTG